MVYAIVFAILATLKIMTDIDIDINTRVEVITKWLLSYICIRYFITRKTEIKLEQSVATSLT